MSNKVYKYRIERNEGMEWVPKCSQDFEDKPTFQSIAKNPYYRILESGIDVTERYRNGAPLESMNIVGAQTGRFDASKPNVAAEPRADNSAEIADKPMKPAEFKALSENDKNFIKTRISQLQQEKTKRTDIMKALNISEATYDYIRSEMTVIPIVDDAKKSSDNAETNTKVVSDYDKELEDW